MAGSIPPDLDEGSFVGTTNIYDLGDLSESNLQEFEVQLRQNLNLIALNLNIKDIGYYPQEEFVNGQLWFPDPALSSTTSQEPEYRQVFRKVINFGALPNTATKNVAHGITTLPAAGNTTFSSTRIYGSATNPATRTFIPIPYASPVLANNISVEANATNVVITTGNNRAAFTTCYIILEYIKS